MPGGWWGCRYMGGSGLLWHLDSLSTETGHASGAVRHGEDRFCPAEGE